MNPCFSAVESKPRVRRSTVVAQQIRDMLMSGELKPGQRLPTEEKLCTFFQVSRTTLREALQDLRVSGLLDVTPGRGSYIRVPHISRVLDDLALYGVCQDNIDVQHVRQQLQLSLLEKFTAQAQHRFRNLYRFTLNRQSSALENAKLEEEWHLLLAELGGGEVARLLLGVLLKIDFKNRESCLENQEEVLRVISVQTRVNNALQDGDYDLAQRLMSSYLGSQPSSQLNIKNKAA